MTLEKLGRKEKGHQSVNLASASADEPFPGWRRPVVTPEFSLRIIAWCSADVQVGPMRPHPVRPLAFCQS